MAVTRLTCRSCEARLKVSAEPGTAVKCPRCGKSIRVPEPEPEDDFEIVDEEEDEPAPKKRKDAIKPVAAKAPAGKAKRPRDEEEEDSDFDEVDEDEEEAPPKRRTGITSKAKANSSALSASKRSRAADDDDDDEEEDERPRKHAKGKKKEKAGSPALLWIGLGGGGLVLVVGVIVAILLLWPVKDKVEPGKPAPGGPGPVAKSRGYQSPQEVYEAHKAALERKDAKTAVDCLDAESKREGLRRLLYTYAWLRTQATEVGVTKSMKATYAAMDKHGMTAEATKTIQFKPTPSAQERDQTGDSLVAMVKDQDGLLIDLINAAFQDTPRGNEEVGVQTVLKDVKIDGNKATGNVARSVKGIDLGNEVMDFVKTDEGWKISHSKDRAQKLPNVPRQP